MHSDSAEVDDGIENESICGKVAKFRKLKIVDQSAAKIFLLVAGSDHLEERENLSSANGEEDEKFRNI